MRLVVVLGYSERRGGVLHPICAARLARGATEPADVVLLSGTPEEVSLMERAWPHPDRPVQRDPSARRTVDSTAETVRLARAIGSDEVALVTSWWHRPRAQLLLRALAGRRPPRIVGVAAGGPWSFRQLLREVACFGVAPLQLAQASRRARPRPRPRHPSSARGR